VSERALGIPQGEPGRHLCGKVKGKEKRVGERSENDESRERETVIKVVVADPAEE
jgi:hypothetical protein